MQDSKEVKIVRCINVPPEGNFIKGNRYRYTAAIDAVGAYDEDCQAWYYDDHRFLWYFAEE